MIKQFAIKIRFKLSKEIESIHAMAKHLLLVKIYSLKSVKLLPSKSFASNIWIKLP